MRLPFKLSSISLTYGRLTGAASTHSPQRHSARQIRIFRLHGNLCWHGRHWAHQDHQCGTCSHIVVDIVVACSHGKAALCQRARCHKQQAVHCWSKQCGQPPAMCYLPHASDMRCLGLVRRCCANNDQDVRCRRRKNAMRRHHHAWEDCGAVS